MSSFFMPLYPNSISRQNQYITKINEHIEAITENIISTIKTEKQKQVIINITTDRFQINIEDVSSIVILVTNILSNLSQISINLPSCINNAIIKNGDTLTIINTTAYIISIYADANIFNKIYAKRGSVHYNISANSHNTFTYIYDGDNHQWFNLSS